MCSGRRTAAAEESCMIIALCRVCREIYRGVHGEMPLKWSHRHIGNNKSGYGVRFQTDSTTTLGMTYRNKNGRRLSLSRFYGVIVRSNNGFLIVYDIKGFCQLKGRGFCRSLNERKRICNTRKITGKGSISMIHSVSVNIFILIVFIFQISHYLL